jgi:hypothetical protein
MASGSQPGSLTHQQHPSRSGAWQSSLSGEMNRGGGQPLAQLIIPRAKMKPRSNYQGYNSDDDAEV